MFLFLRACQLTTIASFFANLSLLFANCNALSSSSSIFPLSVFENSRNVELAISQHLHQQEDQTALILDYDNPKYSNSGLPGDETGGSPFFYCPESDLNTDLFDISKIVINPNPPHINYIWVFHAHGYFREAIHQRNAPIRVRARVKNESRKAIDFTIERNFCDFIDLLEMDGRSTICPPMKGNASIQKIEFVDFGISQGNYSVKIDVIGNNQRVFCIQAWFELSNKEL